VSVSVLPIDTNCELQPDGSFLLRIRGEIDMATAPLVRRALAWCIETDGVRGSVDLADVKLIDAAGLRVLNEVNDDLRRQGGELTVRRPSRHVRRVLEVVKKRCRLRIAPD
jgi:anti-anti-sigma factor